MPECAGVTVPNEPDRNSDPDVQMEMFPPLAANPAPIKSMSTDQRCHPSPGQAAKSSVHGHGVRRSNPDNGRWKYSVIGRDNPANPERNHQQMGE
ncbi:hypothetical protein AVEN_30939-1 [Araneus ventricosus]|uniref:Uncharacterized protein n=1 Tax=Araneus ventricosus TaxID=182803 RepID=A0A4Y2WZ17_ARAVE|nr:hypothetical protein AVEN_30939-1 [Araneus ventricosus]